MPINISYAYNFGSLLGVNLVVMIVTGIALSIDDDVSHVETLDLGLLLINTLIVIIKFIIKIVGPILLSYDLSMEIFVLGVKMFVTYFLCLLTINWKIESYLIYSQLRDLVIARISPIWKWYSRYRFHSIMIETWLPWLSALDLTIARASCDSRWNEILIALVKLMHYHWFWTISPFLYLDILRYYKLKFNVKSRLFRRPSLWQIAYRRWNSYDFTLWDLQYYWDNVFKIRVPNLRLLILRTVMRSYYFQMIHYHYIKYVLIIFPQSDPMRLHKRLYYLIRYKMQPFLREYWWPLKWLFRYVKWRYATLDPDMEEQQCISREKMKESFCKCYQERCRMRLLGYKDKEYYAIKEDIESMDIQAKIAVWDHQWFHQWDKLNSNMPGMGDVKFNLFPYTQYRSETETIRSVSKTSHHSHTCWKVEQHINRLYPPYLHINNSLPVYGPLEKWQVDSNFPPYIDRISTCKALIKVPSKTQTLLDKLVNLYRSVFPTTEMENSIYLMMKSYYPDLSRDEYDYLTSYSLENFYLYFKSILGIDRNIERRLLQYRASKDLYLPPLHDRKLKTRRKIWRPYKWLNIPLWDVKNIRKFNKKYVSHHLRKFFGSPWA